MVLSPLLVLITFGSDPVIPTFVDHTDAAGLTFTHSTTQPLYGEDYRMTSGVGVADVDRDGDLDVFVQGGTGQNSKLFLNDGTGVFEDVALAWHINMIGDEGSSVTLADFTGNGYPDLYAGTIDGRNKFFLNTGSNVFAEFGVNSGAVFIDDTPFESHGTAAGDIDLDGDLDLVTARWGTLFKAIDGNQVFTNTGTGIFTLTTASSGAFDTGELTFGFSPTIIDMDGDRRPELLVAADFGTSLYHVNTGITGFEVLTGNGTGTDENGMGSAVGDYDNDGDFDWFVTSIRDDDGNSEGNWGITGNRLYRNEGDHQYTDVTDLADVRQGYWGWGTSFADYNHDGLLDIAQTNGFILPIGDNPDPDFETDPSRLWLNTGDFETGPTFVERSTEAGLIHTGLGKALVSFDADLDGDLDIIITDNLGDLTYFRNELDPSPQTWIQLDLIPPPGNAPEGIGSVVTLTDGDQAYTRPVVANPSFMSQEPVRVHIGFPPVSAIDEIRIDWPDGTTKVIWDVEPGRVLRLRQADVDGDGAVGILDLLTVLFSWGGCGECPADVNGSGNVDVIDLKIIIGDWMP